MEEFLEKQVRPRFYDFKIRSRSYRKVTTVQRDFHHLLLTVKNRCLILSVQEGRTIVQFLLDSVYLKPSFKTVEVRHVLCHIRGQDSANESLLKSF